MASIDASILDFKQLDLFAQRASRIHRLDPRTKLITTLLFTVAVVSFDKYQLSPLFPFFIFPAVLIGQSNLPALFLVRRVLVVLPFAVMVGLFNPLIDRTPLLTIATITISGGFISWLTIIVKAVLTTSAALILIASTGFFSICRSLGLLGLPRVFTVQLLFLYRFIFLLAEEAARGSRARELRSHGSKGQGIRSYASLVGTLLLRTWQRGERIHLAMLARGFDGEFRTATERGLGRSDALFLIGWTALFAALRIFDLSGMLGAFFAGLLE